MHLHVSWAALGTVLATTGPAAAAELPDLAKIDRTIHKQPAYTAEKPLYGLLAFGPQADKHVWFVLDKSKADESRYDVLYLDRNADGDLTGPDKRFTGEDGEFTIGDLTDPATGVKHTQFQIHADKGADPDVMVSLRWRGDLKFGGGYPADPEPGYMKLAAKPADAPVVWVNADPPFRFQRWYGKELQIDGNSNVKVFLGQPGVGRSTFFAAQVHFLPEKEIVKATLIYHDRDGKEQRFVCELKERC